MAPYPSAQQRLPDALVARCLACMMPPRPLAPPAETELLLQKAFIFVVVAHGAISLYAAQVASKNGLSVGVAILKVRGDVYRP